MDLVTTAAAEIVTWSAIVKWPMMRAAPPMAQCRPVRVLPASAAQPAIGGDHHAGVDQGALAYDAAGIDRHRRTQAAVLADRGIFADGAASIDHDALPQPCPAADVAAGSYRGGGRNFGFLLDDGAGVDSRSGASFGTEQLRGPAIVDVGDVAHDPRQGSRVAFPGRHNH